MRQEPNDDDPRLGKDPSVAVAQNIAVTVAFGDTVGTPDGAVFGLLDEAVFVQHVMIESVAPPEATHAAAPLSEPVGEPAAITPAEPSSKD